jgi:hypothetical protein
MLRVYQSIGLAFLSVPSNTIAHVGVPAESNDRVSGLINLMRNVGGRVGISLLSAAVTSRTQIHQDTLSLHTSSYAPAFRESLPGLGPTLAGFSHQARLPRWRACCANTTRRGSTKPFFAFLQGLADCLLIKVTDRRILTVGAPARPLHQTRRRLCYMAVQNRPAIFI